VVGVDVYGRHGVSLIKGAPGSFSVLYPSERDETKAITLSAVYGTTAYAMAQKLDKRPDEAQDIIDRYFESYPSVLEMMLKAHETVKRDGQVKSLFGRIRRLPEGLTIPKRYGKTSHKELPYQARGILNVAVNFPIQSTGSGIINRASIAFYNAVRAEGITGCHLVMQVHDELVVECWDKDTQRVAELLQHAMETTTVLPGVQLKAKPVIAKNLKDLK
jgi:DNA polymerase-1